MNGSHNNKAVHQKNMRRRNFCQPINTCILCIHYLYRISSRIHVWAFPLLTSLFISHPVCHLQLILPSLLTSLLSFKEEHKAFHFRTTLAAVNFDVKGASDPGTQGLTQL